MARRTTNEFTFTALKSLKMIKSADLFAQVDVRRAAENLEALPDETITDIERTRTRWQAQTHQVHDALPARLADTYVAAFLMPKIPDHQSDIPLTGYFWALAHSEQNEKDVGRVSDSVTRQAYEICRTHQVFHWWLEFPHIFTPRPLGKGMGVRAGGFSVLLGNPPWERIKLQEEEFFASRSPLVAETFSQLLSPNGRAGFIVPTGIATGDSTKAFFEAIS